VCIHHMCIWGMNVCIHFMCLQKMYIPFGQRLGKEERWGRKKKVRHSESPRDTLVASSSFGPNPRANRSHGGAQQAEGRQPRSRRAPTGSDQSYADCRPRGDPRVGDTRLLPVPGPGGEEWCHVWNQHTSKTSTKSSGAPFGNAMQYFKCAHTESFAFRSGAGGVTCAAKMG